MRQVLILLLLTSLSLSADENMEKILSGFLKKHQLPGLAAAVTQDGKIIASGAVGVRKSGSDAKVTLQDKFHIASCTKSMTATLAAMFVEEGKINWTSTIAEIFPEMKAGFLKDYHSSPIKSSY